jgi:hypothetical protein
MLGRGGWQPARAKVAARRDSSKFAMGATATQVRYEYVMDVSPKDGGESFSATMVTPMFCGRWRPLEVGNVVTVLCQPGTGKVRWDKSEPSTSRYQEQKASEEKRKRAADEEFEQALRSRPGARRPD